MSRPTPGLAVLIVDDDRDAAESCAEVLRFHGHEAAVACSPTAAMIEAHSVRPDVVLMDIGIPGMDGYRLAGRICDLLGYKPLLVAVTGYGNLDERSRQEGFDHHFTKPADPAAIDALLAGHAGRRPARAPLPTGAPSGGRCSDPREAGRAVKR